MTDIRILFACGGTGGHINPAIAVARLFRQRKPEAAIAFAGSPDGMESKLVPREGFELKTVDIRSFKRSFNPTSVLRNIKVAAKMTSCLRQARKIILDFNPDVVVGTGGYASFPIVYSAAKLGIPTAIHESNAVPGLTTSMLAKYATSIMVSFEESVSRYARRDAVTVTGTPVREEFVFGSKSEAKERLGIKLPLVLSYWGSLGAREMNKKMAKFIELEAGQARFHHIHATGTYGYRWMPALVKETVDLTKHPNIELLEYVYDMPSAMHAADIIICRAGASTISELTVAAKPAIIVPSPNVAGNHQEKNARVLENRGAAIVISESKCGGEGLFGLVNELLDDPLRLEGMSENLRNMAILDAADRIYDNIARIAAVRG